MNPLEIVGQAVIHVTQALVIDSAARETGVTWGVARECFEGDVWPKYIRAEPSLNSIRSMIDDTVEAINDAQ